MYQLIVIQIILFLVNEQEFTLQGIFHSHYFHCTLLSFISIVFSEMGIEKFLLLVLSRFILLEQEHKSYYSVNPMHFCISISFNVENEEVSIEVVFVSLCLWLLLPSKISKLNPNHVIQLKTTRQYFYLEEQTGYKKFL